MRIAIDTNAILPGQVGGIENYTLGLIEALKLPASPASALLLITRPENHDLFGKFLDARTAAVCLDRPVCNGRHVTNWAETLAAEPEAGRKALATFQRRKGDLLHRLGADLVHFPGNTVNPLDLDLPVVLNLHDLQHRHYPEYFSSAELANRERWWRASAERADALIAASDYVRDDLVAQWDISADRIFVTPDPCEAQYFEPPTAEHLAELKTRKQLPDRYFIYPAAAWPHKNHERLIRAFAEANLSETELLLTGGGQTESGLGGLIESLGLANRVRLLGRVSAEDLMGLYHLATGMVFPSQHESWSIPVMEAMASGCPVASSNVTSLPEEVGDAGILFDPDSTAAIANAISMLATDQDLRERLAMRGHERVRQFSPERFVAVLTDAYQFAVQHHRVKQAA